MNYVWSQFTLVFVSFLKHVLPSIKHSEAAPLAVESWSKTIAGWASCLMGLYFTSAIAIAVGSLQVQTQLPLIFHFLFLSILLGFSSLLFAEFLKFKSLMTNQILHCLSLFSLVLAFFVAISIPFPLYFKIVSSIVFLILCFATICWNPGTGGTSTTDQEPSQEVRSPI